MKNNHTIAHTPKELLHELKTLAVEAETMMVDSVSEHSAEALGNLRERFGHAQDRFADLYKDAKKKVVTGVKYTNSAISEYPCQALAIALGMGVLVGLLMHNRRK